MECKEAGRKAPQRRIPDAAFGLSNAEAEERRKYGLYNKCRKNITRTAGQILRENILTFFNALHGGIFLALIVVDSFHNLLFLGVILSNLAIGLVQEFKSKRAIEKLSLLNMPQVSAIREGRQLEIKCEQIVLDDILLLSMGQQIPADCELVQGAVEVDESHLTGESHPQFKQEGDGLLSGSAIVSGRCRARVVRLGRSCYANVLAEEARRYKRPRSELMRSLRVIIRFAGALVVPLGALLFSIAFFGLDHPLQSAVERTAAAMLGMIPSGLMLLCSVSLSVGVISLSRRNTLAQQPHCIETLSRVNMLCLDKTGTLTTGNLHVEKLLYAHADTGAVDKRLYRLVGAIPADNATARALHSYTGAEESREEATVTAFSSARRYSAAAFSDCALYLGAPEILCPSLPESVAQEAAAALAEGYRVLAFAMGACRVASAGEAPGGEVSSREAPGPDKSALTLQALLLLRDEIREEAGGTLQFFLEQGVAIKLISGDNPLTAAHIAKRLYLPGAERYVDMSGLSDGEVEQAAGEYSVFGRVSPAQKRLIVRALRKNYGYTVAMTGDGVNDLLALREADCSIALYNGSDAARQISQLVLLTNDFSALPAAVMEGRRVINNITRAASLFLGKTIYSFLLTACSVLLGISYPFQPIQLTLISSLTIGIPSFVLSLEPNRARIRGNFLRNVFTQAVPGSICVCLYVLAVVGIGPRLGMTKQGMDALCVYLAGTVCLLVLLRVCMPLKGYRAMLFFTMTALFFGASVLFRGLLHIALPPTISMVVFYGVFAGACYPLLALFSRWVRYISLVWRKKGLPPLLQE